VQDDRWVVADSLGGQVPNSEDGGQGGATEITAERFNGLMSAHQKVLAENRALKAGQAGGGLAPEGQDDSASEQQTQQWEPGTLLEVGDDGEMVAYEPPTPYRHNEPSRGIARRESTDAEDRAKLDQMVGKPSRGGDPWAHITD
jgi:hypothetical protein